MLMLYTTFIYARIPGISVNANKVCFEFEWIHPNFWYHSVYGLESNLALIVPLFSSLLQSEDKNSHQNLTNSA